MFPLFEKTTDLDHWLIIRTTFESDKIFPLKDVDESGSPPEFKIPDYVYLANCTPGNT